MEQSAIPEKTEGSKKQTAAALRERLSQLRIPIRVKLSIAITFLICLTILVLSTVILKRQSEQLYRQTVQTGKVSLNYFVNNARVPLLNDNILGLNTLIKEAASVEGLLYAIIADRKQVIKADTDYSRIGAPLQPFVNAKNVTRDGETTYFKYKDQSGRQILNLSRPVTFQDKDLGVIHVGISVDFIREQIRKESIFIFALTVLIVIIGITVAILLGVGFSRPISTLVVGTQEVSKGNFQYKVNVASNDELGDLASSFNFMSRELWTKSLMQTTFGRYVSPEVLNMILANPEDSWLKGTRNEASILFSDVRGFTSYSETKEPEEIVEALNEYFAIATQFVLEYGGHVDKFIGDAVLGVFGVPVPHSDHAERAVRAAVAMQKGLKKAAQNGNPLLSSIGIGINSGVVVSGNLGSNVKMEYTVIGDSVNVASRLNGLAGSGEVIISKGIHESIKDLVSVESLPPQKIKGKAEPVETFRVLDIK